MPPGGLVNDRGSGRGDRSPLDARCAAYEVAVSHRRRHHHRRHHRHHQNCRSRPTRCRATNRNRGTSRNPSTTSRERTSGSGWSSRPGSSCPPAPAPEWCPPAAAPEWCPPAALGREAASCRPAGRGHGSRRRIHRRGRVGQVARRVLRDRHPVVALPDELIGALAGRVDQLVGQRATVAVVRQPLLLGVERTERGGIAGLSVHRVQAVGVDRRCRPGSPSTRRRARPSSPAAVHRPSG